MKKLRITFIIVTGLFLYTIVLTSVSRVVFTHPDQGSKYFSKLPNLIISFTDIGKNIKNYFYPFYLINNSLDADGFTYSDSSSSLPNHQLLVSYKTERYGGVFELYNLKTGEVIKRWEPDNQLIYNNLCMRL